MVAGFCFNYCSQKLQLSPVVHLFDVFFCQICDRYAPGLLHLFPSFSLSCDLCLVGSVRCDLFLDPFRLDLFPVLNAPDVANASQGSQVAPDQKTDKHPPGLI